jgi:hypothetical protein
MMQEEKELIFKDLCSRLPYHVKVKVWLKDGTTEEGVLDLEHNYGDVLRDAFYYNKIVDVKPYLRSMASMTEEEWEELNCIGYIVPLYDGCFGVDMRAYCKNSQPHYRRFSEFSTIEDWFNAHHFDYRGLIEKGLALEAPDGMYNIKEYNKI